MPPRDELIALIEGILPRAEFYTRERRFFRPPDSVFLNSEDYRTEHYRVRLDTFMGERMPISSDFIRPAPDLDRFPEEQFNRLVALVEELLDRYTDPENHRFVAVLPATRVYQDNVCNSAEHFSKSIVRCAALFGVPETVDAVLRLIEGDTSKYTQVVVLGGVSTSHNGEEVELWPGARLIEWHQAFGDPRHESPLGIPDGVLTLVSCADFNNFSFGRGNTLLCIDRTGGPIIRRSENAEPGPGGPYVPVSPHKLSTEIAISALSLTVNHPIFEICSWHWYDAKVQSLLGYRNELGPDQNLDAPRLLEGRTIEAKNAPGARYIYEFLSQPGVFEKLIVPIQRWRRSKAAWNGVDLAIDLRTALESLFLDDGNNAELSFRLALRAAWYLGSEGDARSRIFEAVRGAYNIGSKAVHTGKGYDEVIPANLVDAQNICRAAILRRISEGGNAPNWRNMVLGD